MTEKLNDLPPEAIYPANNVGSSVMPPDQYNSYIEQIDNTNNESDREDLIYGIPAHIADLSDGLSANDVGSVDAALQLADAYVARMPFQPRGSEWGDVMEAQIPIHRIINKFTTLNRPDLANRYEPLLNMRRQAIRTEYRKSEIAEREELARNGVTHEDIDKSELWKAEPALTSLVGKLAESIKSGEYNLIIGDDTSGRLPALLVYHLAKNYSKDHPEVQAPELLFVAGGGGVENRSKAIGKHLANFSLKNKSKPVKPLLVTELIETADSETALLKTMDSVGLSADVATVGILESTEPKNDNSFENKLERVTSKLGGRALYYGGIEGTDSGSVRLNGGHTRYPLKATIKPTGEIWDGALAQRRNWAEEPVQSLREFLASRQALSQLEKKLYERYFAEEP